MTTQLVYKGEIKPNVFVVCTLRNKWYQVQLHHAGGIKYQSTTEPSRAVEIMKQYIEEAKQND
jgi:hypothetical protein